MRITARPTTPELGLRSNLGQFALLVGVNALVGAALGQERAILPLLATRVFGLAAFTSALTFIVVFGLVKAATNLAAGALADRFGRRPVLVAGWLVAIPVPLLLMWAPSWGWVIVANALLGVSQGLTWSMTVVMKVDLAGPARRGLATGLNEAAGYGAMALAALATGVIAEREGLRPEPFFLGLAVVGFGIGISALLVRETRGHAILEAGGDGDRVSARWIFLETSFRERALSSATQAGVVNNLNDAVAWGLFPLLFARAGLSMATIGVLAALYPAVWAVGQLVTGALSDRLGRKGLIAAGMWIQAAGLALIASTQGFGTWAAGSFLLGAGTAMVYPTLLATIGDVAGPGWRASALGVYRSWRDAGFAIGALLAGILADLLSVQAAVGAVAALTLASGIVVAARMYETRPR
jgi:MFS family permease